MYTSAVPWFGSFVPSRYTFVPLNVSVKEAPAFAHLFVPPIKFGPLSSVHPLENWKLSVFEMSITSIPSGAAPVSSKPSLAL